MATSLTIGVLLASDVNAEAASTQYTSNNFNDLPGTYGSGHLLLRVRMISFADISRETARS